MAFEPIAIAMAAATSAVFRKYIDEQVKKKKKPAEIVRNTVDELAEQQAEGLTYETVYRNLLENRITEEQATKTIEILGGKVNPHPLVWLKEKLLNIRSWILSAIKFLRGIGNEAGLKVKQIEVELSLTPRVTITFESSGP